MRREGGAGPDLEERKGPPRLGSKNWMFIGGVDTGDRTAIIHTMVGNIRQGGGDPYACPEDLFERLPAMTNHDHLTPLLPRHWLEARRKEAADRETASVPELREFPRRCPAPFPPRSRRAASSAYEQAPSP